MSLKEKIEGLMVGMYWILLFVIRTLLTMAPFIIFRCSFFVALILSVVLWAVSLIPYLGVLCYVCLWVSSFVIVVSNPIGVFEIIYLICLAINIWMYVIPYILNIFIILREKRLQKKWGDE